MLVGRVVCAGISCLDLQLCGSSGGGGEGGVETIRKFEETRYGPGGSCPQASTALARLGVPGVVAVTKMGVDAHGDEMVRQASVFVCVCVHACVRNICVHVCLCVFWKCWWWCKLGGVFCGCREGGTRAERESAINSTMFLSVCIVLLYPGFCCRVVLSVNIKKNLLGFSGVTEATPADT